MHICMRPGSSPSYIMWPSCLCHIEFQQILHRTPTKQQKQTNWLNVSTHHHTSNMMHHACAYILFHISIKPIPFWHPGPCHLQHPTNLRCCRGVAIGSGTQVTMDSAQVILLGSRPEPDRRWNLCCWGWMIWMIWMEDSGRFSRWDKGKPNGEGSSWDGKGTIVNGAVFLKDLTSFDVIFLEVC